MIRPAAQPDIPTMIELLHLLFAIEADFDFSAERQGRGLELLLAEWGVGRGADRMQLLADHTNHPALDFYRQKGWQETQLLCLRNRSHKNK